MPIKIDGNENPVSSDNTPNIVQIVKSLAFQMKQVTGKPNWYTPPDRNLHTLSQLIQSGGIQGLKGDKGDTGDRGEQGLQGLQGLKGDKGDTGDRGEQGLQGIQGLKGDKGDAGDRGEQGLQGIQGLKGDTGDTGDRGEQGLQGIQGLKGDKGDTGDRGEQGLQGIQGLKGDKGDTGDRGEQGLQGIQGLKGDIGAQGIQGLKGDTGAQGIQGNQGATGANGNPFFYKSTTLLAANVANNAVSNVLTISIPSGTLKIGSIMRITAYAQTLSGAVNGMSFRLFCGSQYLLSTTLTAHPTQIVTSRLISIPSALNNPICTPNFAAGYGTNTNTPITGFADFNNNVDFVFSFSNSTGQSNSVQLNQVLFELF